MEPSSIELKVLSCKALKTFNFFQKLTAYALVYIDSNDPKRELDEKQEQEQRTHTDRHGGDDPEWNQEIKFDLGWVSLQDCDHLFFHFEFRHDGFILGDRLIGEVRVPLKDLIQEAGRALGVARFVNYEVRSGDGKPNGIFYFSYRLIDKKGVATRNSSENLEGKIGGYPVLDPDLKDHNSTNKPRFQRPTLEIQSRSCDCGSSYPSAISPVDPLASGLFSPSAPPPVSSPSSADYCHYYPAPSPHYPPPPPMPPYPFPVRYPFPPPPPPPVSYGLQYYGPVGPEAHGWTSDPNFQHPRSRGW